MTFKDRRSLNALFRLTVAMSLSVVALGAQTIPAPGGFIELATSTLVRPFFTRAQIATTIPATRSPFLFPAPYLTQAFRLTLPADCQGQDCVSSVGYSYWRNINNHAGSRFLYIFLSLDQSRGGDGPTLFSVDKDTGAVAKVGPLFDAADGRSWASGEGWYFSATLPTILYVHNSIDTKLSQYDVLSHTTSTVLDISHQAALYGTNTYIWQTHSSNDDAVHSFTVRLNDGSGYPMLGCGVYLAGSKQYKFYRRVSTVPDDYDECQIDKSGRWLVIKEQVDQRSGGDNRIIDLQTNTETVLLDELGAGGHSDLGFGYMVAKDNWSNTPSLRLWQFGTQSLSSGTVVYQDPSWAYESAEHVSHLNATPSPAGGQYACGSGTARTDGPRIGEIVCFRLDGSMSTLVVAPVMTDLNASGGGDDYGKMPKGNLDITGQYFIWTSNLGGNRQDAFLVRVPSQLLTGSLDRTPPAVAWMDPTPGAVLSGLVSLLATAVDNVGIATVQFALDGARLGAEFTFGIYATLWNTTTAADGQHQLTVIARDNAGNSTTSPPLSVVVRNPPQLSAIAVSDVSAVSATVNWSSSLPTSGRLDYGLSTAYGTSSQVDAALAPTHSVVLSGLTPATTYHFRINSQSTYGTPAASYDHTFTTAVTPVGPGSGTEPIRWTSLVNARMVGVLLRKTGGCNGCADAGALSWQQITGDGFVEFAATEKAPLRTVGLTGGPGDRAADPFALWLSAGHAEVREGGVYRADVSFNQGDLLRISVRSQKVTYSRNGVVFYSSRATASLPLVVRATLLGSNASISAATISPAAVTTESRP